MENRNGNKNDGLNSDDWSFAVFVGVLAFVFGAIASFFGGHFGFGLSWLESAFVAIGIAIVAFFVVTAAVLWFLHRSNVRWNNALQAWRAANPNLAHYKIRTYDYMPRDVPVVGAAVQRRIPRGRARRQGHILYQDTATREASKALHPPNVRMPFFRRGDRNK